MSTFPDGVCTLDLYDQPGQYVIPRREYAQLVEAWKRGEAFLMWTGHYGQTMTVKGARVECIAEWSAEAWAEKEAESKADALTGDD